MKTELEWEWEYKGIKCRINLNSYHPAPIIATLQEIQTQWRCGYVTIPKTHPYTQIASYFDVPVEVHGGLTYMDSRGDTVTYGFDCHHGGDTTERWPLKAVVAETEQLAEQFLLSAKAVE